MQSSTDNNKKLKFNIQTLRDNDKLRACDCFNGGMGKLKYAYLKKKYKKIKIEEI